MGEVMSSITKEQEIKALKIGYAATLDARRIAEEVIDAGEVPKKHVKRLRSELYTASITLAAMIMERENENR